MAMVNIYLLKDLAALSGQSIHTIKYYLKLGLMREAGRTPVSNFRYFDDASLDVLKRIRDLRVKSVPIKEIRDLISWEGGK